MEQEIKVAQVVVERARRIVSLAVSEVQMKKNNLRTCAYHPVVTLEPLC